MPDGKAIGLFDGSAQAKPEMIGKIKEISILIPIGKVTSIEKTEPRIEPSVDNPLDYHSHTIYGVINNLYVEDIWHKKFKYENLISVNVGMGDVIVKVGSEQLKNLNIGDYIKVYNARCDLVSIGKI